MGMLPGDKLGPPEPRKPRPMTPSGRVVPPTPPKQSRREQKEANEKFVDAVSRHRENMILGFVVDEDTGDVKLSYRVNGFPSGRFEQAAECFADMLTRLIASNPEAVAEIRAAQEQAAAEAAQQRATETQNSEPVTDADLNSLPGSI